MISVQLHQLVSAERILKISLQFWSFFHMGVSRGCGSDDHKFQIQNPLLLALSFSIP
jgi:hypothetical protein